MKDEKQILKGFKTLWLQFDRRTKDNHQLFLKEHSVRNQQAEHPKGRTLFVLNIPPYIPSEVLQKVFSHLCGEVTSVFYVTSKGFKTAYVVFEKEPSLEKALELPEDFRIVVNYKFPICPVGLAKWSKEYNNSICNEISMKQEIEAYMENYDKQIAEKKANEKAIQEAVDNDGWITVTGQKKRGEFALSRKESTINKVQQKEDKKNKKKQLLNFYTFQIRESKKQNLAELRKKFELDKQRLQKLKTKRTFKPFG